MRIKTLVSATIATLFATTAFAGQPNMYSCEGIDSDIQVGYSSSSFTGEPQFDVIIDGVNHTPMADENLDVTLRTENTILGKLVSATAYRRMIADAPSLIYTLVVPNIELGDAHEATFETVLLRGSVGGFLPIPAVYQRVNEAEKLTCTAFKVFF